jgi:hypothetical protein
MVLDAALIIGLSGVARGAYEVVPPRRIRPRQHVLDARAKRRRRTRCVPSEWRETHDMLILQANSIDCGATPGGPRGGHVSRGGAGTSARGADRAGAARDADRGQGRRLRQVGPPRPPGAGRLGWSPAPRQSAIGHGGRSTRSSIGGRSFPSFLPTSSLTWCVPVPNGRLRSGCRLTEDGYVSGIVGRK